MVPTSFPNNPLENRATSPTESQGSLHKFFWSFQSYFSIEVIVDTTISIRIIFYCWNWAVTNSHYDVNHGTSWYSSHTSTINYSENSFLVKRDTLPPLQDFNYWINLSKIGVNKFLYSFINNHNKEIFLLHHLVNLAKYIVEPSKTGPNSQISCSTILSINFSRPNLNIPRFTIVTPTPLQFALLSAISTPSLSLSVSCHWDVPDF